MKNTIDVNTYVFKVYSTIKSKAFETSLILFMADLFFNYLCDVGKNQWM